MHTELGFFLNGRVLSNNSIVLLSDIGEGSGALYCLTDREVCCSFEAGANRGRWDFPNVHNVGSDGTADFYSSKGFSSILLNRRSSAGVPTGVYRCLIPDAGDVLRNLYIGIYDDPSAGEVTWDNYFAYYSVQWIIWCRCMHMSYYLC